MTTAGVTVFIRQGIYNEQLIPENSGTAEAPITFASYLGDTAISLTESHPVDSDDNTWAHYFPQSESYEVPA